MACSISRIAITLTAALLAAASALVAAADLSGAGATFPAPLYTEWTKMYRERTGIAIDYAATGSGAGIALILRKEVDFAATDEPLTPDAQKELGVAQFPMVIGGVVPVVNLVGVKPGALMLNGQILGDIYLGKIRQWNDPAIALLNPGLTLPESNITVVHRSDASGTTFLWTDYLSKVNPAWKADVGAGASVNWPIGVAGLGNQGVASYVQRTRMSIGYVEYAYAKANHLRHAAMQNRDGAFVQPSRDSFAAALATAQWTQASGFFQILTDAPGIASWPVSGASYILLRSAAEKPAQSREAMKFFSWALSSGQAAAERLDYAALPPGLAHQVEQAFNRQVRDMSGNAIWQP